MSVRVRDVSPEVAELQVRRYRGMSPAEKLALADALWRVARDAIKAGVQMRHPELDEPSADRAAREIMRRATD